MTNREKIDHIVKWLKDYCTESGLNGFCLGISGGIDSAVCSTLCAMTGLPTHVYYLDIYSSKESRELAMLQTNYLIINHGVFSTGQISLKRTFDTFIEETLTKGEDKLALANTKARLRMTTLYYYASLHSCLVVGTDNLVESLTGHFSKHGDGACDILPIADLLKSEVIEIAKHLGIPKEIIEVSPTDDLFEDNQRTDEESFGCTYEELEEVIKEYNGKSAIMDVLIPRKEEVRKIYLNLNKKSEHKRNLPPICVIPK